jgi:hypothetical protein
MSMEPGATSPTRLEHLSTNGLLRLYADIRVFATVVGEPVSGAW